MKSKRKGNWIKSAINPAHKGMLHRMLGVAMDRKIPAAKLNAAAKQGGALGRRARLARTLRGFHHGK